MTFRGWRNEDNRLDLAASIFAALVPANLGLHFKVLEFKEAIWFPFGTAAAYFLAMIIAADEEYW